MVGLTFTIPNTNDPHHPSKMRQSRRPGRRQYTRNHCPAGSQVPVPSSVWTHRTSPPSASPLGTLTWQDCPRFFSHACLLVLAWTPGRLSLLSAGCTRDSGHRKGDRAWVAPSLSPLLTRSQVPELRFCLVSAPDLLLGASLSETNVPS